MQPRQQSGHSLCTCRQSRRHGVRIYSDTANDTWMNRFFPLAHSSKALGCGELNEEGMFRHPRCRAADETGPASRLRRHEVCISLRSFLTSPNSSHRCRLDRGQIHVNACSRPSPRACCILTLPPFVVAHARRL